MAIANYSKFNQFKELIQSLPEVSEATITGEGFLLEKDEKRKLEIYYAPFEYVNEKSKVVIVGITPGLNQMYHSYLTVFNAKGLDISDEVILSQVKNNSSFEGVMRKNLVKMLDELELNKHLNLSSVIELFDTASSLVHTTSIITYPVFHKDENYGGTTPNMLRAEILKKYATGHFLTEMNQIDKPIIIPLGVKVDKVINYLIEQKLLDPKLVLSGFPHPSGQNGSRKKQFEANKEIMKEKLNNHFN